jgi:hypothetical protein
MNELRLFRDMVETTAAYQEAMQEIQPILEAEFRGRQPKAGLCYKIWERQKELLAERGISWQTPAEINPDVRFD